MAGKPAGLLSSSRERPGPLGRVVSNEFEGCARRRDAQASCKLRPRIEAATSLKVLRTESLARRQGTVRNSPNPEVLIMFGSRD